MTQINCALYANTASSKQHGSLLCTESPQNQGRMRSDYLLKYNMSGISPRSWYFPYFTLKPCDGGREGLHFTLVIPTRFSD